MTRLLHVLSQRPLLTGSGVTLDALVRHSTAAGWEQHAVVGTPAGEPSPSVGDLGPERIHPLVFDTVRLQFPVPGMSDVMPYPSTRFGTMDRDQLHAYRHGWRSHLAEVIAETRPEVVHSHHVWILGALLKDVAPHTPVITHCHATGLRQMQLCPHLAGEVRRGCARNEYFVVLHRAHALELQSALGVTDERVEVVGAGYRDDVFCSSGRRQGVPPRLVYIGKYSSAKGLPQLLDAFEELRSAHPHLELHVAGSGAGAEADGLRARMSAMGPEVVLHGQLDQVRLARLLRTCAVCVLPSFYEGLPLVLVEAIACGCRLVATRLPGIEHELAPHLGDALMMVEPPRLVGVDSPDPAALPAFVRRLSRTISSAVKRGPMSDPDKAVLAPFTWGAVFRRIETVWMKAISGTTSS